MTTHPFDQPPHLKASTKQRKRARYVARSEGLKRTIWQAQNSPEVDAVVVRSSTDAPFWRIHPEFLLHEGKLITKSRARAKKTAFEFRAELRELITEELERGAEPRNARLDARLTPKERAVIQRAADISGRSLSDFVVHAAHQAALREIEHEVILRLSERDSDSLVAALEAEPSEPTPAFKRAVAMRDKISRQPKADKG